MVFFWLLKAKLGFFDVFMLFMFSFQVKQPNLSELQAEQIKLDIALKKIALASAINTCTFDVKALIGSTCEQIVANANDGSEIASTATQQDTLNTTVTSVRTDDNAVWF